MNCNICKRSSTYIFSSEMLSKYNTRYYRCDYCGFIQTEAPYWLEEAYSSAITSLDIGLISRNLTLFPITSALINQNFNPGATFLDYGGGYGMFTRLMRDNGFAFYRQDIYCENLFAKGFDISDLRTGVKFELVTAFEVFEHLPNPEAAVSNMLKYSDSIFFSTELVPAGVHKKDDWWYFMPETGQHISLHTAGSLNFLAKAHNLNYYTNNRNLHLFTPKKLNAITFKLLMNYRVAKLVNIVKGRRSSFLDKDYDFILEKGQPQSS